MDANPAVRSGPALSGEVLCHTVIAIVPFFVGRKSKAGPLMATGTFTPQQLQNLRDFATQCGKIIARRAAGDAGPPLDADLFTLEQAAQAAAQGLLQGTLATVLEQQARSLPEHCPCPDCQHLCPVRHEPRPLDCLGGSVTYDEP